MNRQLSIRYLIGKVSCSLDMDFALANSLLYASNGLESALLATVTTTIRRGCAE